MILKEELERENTHTAGILYTWYIPTVCTMYNVHILYGVHSMYTT